MTATQPEQKPTDLLAHVMKEPVTDFGAKTAQRPLLLIEPVKEHNRLHVPGHVKDDLHAYYQNSCVAMDELVAQLNPKFRPTFESLGGLWKTYLQHTLYQFAVVTRHKDAAYFSNNAACKAVGVVGLSLEWQTPSTFLKEVVGLSNFIYWQQMMLISPTSYDETYFALTGIYYDDGIVGPQTAVFLARHEAAAYLRAKEEGLIKVHFRNQSNNPRPAQYLFSLDQVEDRVTDSEDIARLEKGAQAEGGKVLRYGMGWVQD